MKLIVGIGLSRWIAWKNAGPEGLVAIMITARLSAMAALMAALTAGLAAGCASGASGTRVVNLYNAPQESIGAIAARCNREAHGRYRIVVNTLPRSADDQREQLVRRLAARDSGLDVLGLDVTWTAELAQAGWIREWTGTVLR